MSDTPDNSSPEPGTDVQKAERPEYVADKFWDAETGAVRTENLARSYNDLERLIGSRVGDLGPEARRKLAEALPDTLRDTWAEDFKAKLGEDPEFTGKLEEQWRVKYLPEAPESYQLPTREDGYEYDAEHPLYLQAVEFAKENKLGQEAFAKLMALGFEARREYEIPPDVDQWKEAIPDIEERAKPVYNRLQSIAPKYAADLVKQVRDPLAFLALEALVKATGAKSLPIDPNPAPEQMTQAKLDQMMLDKRYYDPVHRDPAFVAQVEQGFKRLYSDTL